MPETRYNQYEVVFSDKDGRDYAMIEIFVGDLETVKSLLVQVLILSYFDEKKL